MSQLSSWWHNFVNGLGVSQSIKDFLNNYGLYFVWGGGILLGLLLVGALFGGC